MHIFTPRSRHNQSPHYRKEVGSRLDYVFWNSFGMLSNANWNMEIVLKFDAVVNLQHH